MRTATADYYGSAQSARHRGRSQGAARPGSITSHRRILELVNTHNSSLLFEPNAKLPESSWSSRDDERTEVGTQLAVLKKKHDQSKDALSKRDGHLQTLRSELAQLSSIEQQAQNTHSSVMSRVQRLEEEIQQTRALREKAKDERLVYEHVIERMKTMKVHLEMQSHQYHSELKNRKLVVSEQLQKMRKSQEHSFIARQAVEVAKQLLTQSEQQQDSSALELERSLRLRQEIASRREERQTRQAEIAEHAANMQQDAEETRLRQGYLLHKFWWHTLQRKLEKDKAQSVEIEEAFQRIKIATGVGDVREIVEKFLTKEQTYSRLVHAVTDTERRVESLKQAIEDEQQDIRRFQVSEEKLSELSDIKELDQMISRELKEVQSAQNKLQKHVIAYDHVAEWVRKVYSQLYRIRHKTETVPDVEQTDNFLVRMFQKLSALVDDLLEPIKAQREEVIRTVDSLEGKKVEELIQQSPESVRKVVRVRPVLQEDESADIERKDAESPEGSKRYIGAEAEAIEDLQEARRRIKHMSTLRQESARKKKLKEKKQDVKKEK